MGESDKIHELEVKVEALSARIKYGLAAVIFVAGVLGWLGYDTIEDARSDLRMTIQKIAGSEIVQETIELRDEARRNAAAVRKALKTSCHDPKWVDKTGKCIFNLLPEGRYTLNYGAATALCTAHGARLCTLAKVREAYAKGTEWCAWSWVADTKRPFRKGLSGRNRCESRRLLKPTLEPPCGRRPPERSIAARRCVTRPI